MATWTLAPSTTAALRLSSPLLRADRPPSAHRFHSLLPSRLRCRSIGTVQRGPAAGRGALGVRCGATVIDQGCFEAEVLHSESPVLVEFIADWCGPCRLIAPLVDWVAELLIYHGTVRLQDWLVQTKSLALSFCLSSTQGKLK